MLRHSHLYLPAMLWVIVLGLVATAVAKGPRPSGTLSIATTSVAVGIGVHWGNGILTV
jgi:hypothetical protein